MDFLKKFPKRADLLGSYREERTCFPLKVNNHIHTPHSFSAFKSTEEAVKMAHNEDVSILGINDFYVTDGYGEFIELCLKYRIFPLLNIELIGISRKDQQAGIRINDPKNPGRTYISGKGLAFPSILTEHQQEKLNRIVEESNRQVAAMTEQLNRWLEFQQTGLSISVDEIRERQAGRLLRERHLAQALRLKLEETAGDDDSYYTLLEQVYGGKASEKERNDPAGTEEELRARLLKSGAPAFVPEDEKAFMKLEEITAFIKAAGGIPTYPMLLDGAGGGITEFENDREKLRKDLDAWGFRSVELIPLRNRMEVLKAYAEFFYEHGFTVFFGTEHNTSTMLPLTVSAWGNEALDDSLMEISFNGAAFQAAHQYLTVQDGPAYESMSRDEMETLGKAVLYHYFQTIQ